MKLEHIELDRLSISAANMRAKDKAPDLSNILPSVRERGVLVPLLVRPKGDPDRFEIVAGRRRFHAAQAVAAERREPVSLPCGIIEAGDDAAALEASLIENFARLDPDEVAQWETFARLVREGRSVEDIGATFGVTERLVRRILALGNLVPRIRALYRQEKLDAATVRHLTLATKVQQREWLALYDSPDGYAPTGHRLKEWLFGGATIPTSAALFDLADYPKPIVTDLFGDDSYFSDSEAFWSLQNAAIEAKRQAYLDAGWSAVDVLEPGDYFNKWEHDRRSRAKGGKVYLTVSARGEVEAHEGYLPTKEARRADRPDAAPPPPRREVTAALQNYLDLHRHAAVRARLTEQPGVALRLAVAHMVAGSPLWNVRADPQRADKPATRESVAASTSEALFAAKRREAVVLLGFDAEASGLLDAGRYESVGELFERLLALTDADVLGILGVVMGEALASGSEAVERLGVHLAVDMAQLWQADGAFFELVRDKEVLTAIVAEVAGPEVAAANKGEKGATLKAVVRDCLVGDNGRPKFEGWVPAWLRFPAGAYTARGRVAADETVDAGNDNEPHEDEVLEAAE